MAVKKKEEVPFTNSNINTNNNTNNVNVNVKLEHPKTRVRTKEKEKDKPNWLVKAVVLALIGLVVSVLGFYLKNANGNNKPAVIENGSPAISGEKTN